MATEAATNTPGTADSQDSAHPPAEPAAAAAATPSGAREGGHHSFELPRLRALIMHALPRFIEGVVAPVAVFYAAFALLGLNGGLIAAVAWVYGGMAWRYWRGHGVSGVMMLAAVGVTVRAGLAAATHSAVVYFLQPTLGTLMVAMAFLASVPLRRPLALKLARDMVPLPEAFLKHDRVRQFFLRISLLWSMVFFANAMISIYMLFHESLSMYLWVRTGLVTGLGAAAVGVSIWGFKRCLHHVDRQPARA